MKLRGSIACHVSTYFRHARPAYNTLGFPLWPPAAASDPTGPVRAESVDEVKDRRA